MMLIWSELAINVYVMEVGGMTHKEYFEAFWKENYRGIIPLGYILREHFFN
jgi:hypothetical protein